MVLITMHQKYNLPKFKYHRVQLNNNYLEEYEKNGMIPTGINPDTGLVEVIEIPSHKWFVGVQYHPEYKSTVLNPHPLFVAVVKATINFAETTLANPITKPMDRSIPPVIITKVSAVPSRKIAVPKKNIICIPRIVKSPCAEILKIIDSRRRNITAHLWPKKTNSSLPLPVSG